MNKTKRAVWHYYGPGNHQLLCKIPNNRGRLITNEPQAVTCKRCLAILIPKARVIKSRNATLEVISKDGARAFLKNAIMTGKIHDFKPGPLTLIDPTPEPDDNTARLQWAACVGLLCQCSIKLRPGAESEEIRDNIERAAQAWCDVTGWKVDRLIDSIEVLPPEM